MYNKTIVGAEECLATKLNLVMFDQPWLFLQELTCRSESTNSCPLSVTTAVLTICIATNPIIPTDEGNVLLLWPLE